jgi:hypothetical protein
LQKIASLVVIALIVGLALRVPNVSAPGFGATCLNRHDARITSVLVKAPGVNYTGSGDEIVAGWLWGYDYTIFLKVNPTIMMNAEPDTTNGSIFISTDVNGVWAPRCLYNVASDVGVLYIQGHPANLTGFENSHQLVTWKTGTSSGQYNVSWIGP